MRAAEAFVRTVAWRHDRLAEIDDGLDPPLGQVRALGSARGGSLGLRTGQAATGAVHLRGRSGSG
jgi:hypothetical protein